MAYSKKPSKKVKDAAELELAKSQWNSYTRARDSGHEEYVHMAKKCDRTTEENNGTSLTCSNSMTKADQR